MTTDSAPTSSTTRGQRGFTATTMADGSAVVTLSVQKMSSCDATATLATVEETNAGSTSLRYDSTSGQFIQNWKTPTTAGCYKVTVTPQAGSGAAAIIAYFKINK